MLKSKLFNQVGMTLVEAMVGLAIAGGIGLVLMRQQENSSKMQTKNNINQVVNSAAQVIQTSLSNRAICSKSLATKMVNQSVSALVDAKINPLFPGASTDEFIKTMPEIKHVYEGQELPGDVKILSMRIVVDPTSSKEYLSVVFDTDPRRVKKKFGSNTIAKQFQLQTLKNSSGQIISCYSEQTNLLDSAIANACTSMGAQWDSATRKCKLVNLPNCIVSNEACRGVFNTNRGSWKIKIYTFNGRTCTMHYKKDGPWCSGSFDRTCQCSSPGCTCNNNFGQVSCFRREDRGCADNPYLENFQDVNRCCQQ